MTANISFGIMLSFHVRSGCGILPPFEEMLKSSWKHYDTHLFKQKSSLRNIKGRIFAMDVQEKLKADKEINRNLYNIYIKIKTEISWK